MKHYFDTVVSTAGVALSGVIVSVYTDSGYTTLATVYSDDGVTTKTNPITTDSSGGFDFYVADGRYYIKAVGSGVTILRPDVEIADITEAGSADTAWKVARLNSVRYADQFPGSDIGAKINAAILDLGTTGGTVDARGFNGTYFYSTTINMAKDVQLLLGTVTLLYQGTGDAISFSTPSNCTTTTTVRHAAIKGLNKWATIISVDPTFGATAASVVHIKWCTHIKLEDVTLTSNGVATTTLWDEQSLDTQLSDVVIYNDRTGVTVGHVSWRMTGSGYGHHKGVSVAGGEYALLIETTATSIPANVASVNTYITDDGQSVHFNVFENLQCFSAYKTNFKMIGTATNKHIEENTFHGILSLGGGVNAADTDDENGMYLTIPAAVGTGQIRNNSFYGTHSVANGSHGILLEGNVVRNFFYGIYSGSNGAVGVNPAYALWLKAGTGVFPVENKFAGALDVSTAQTANKALRVDASCSRNAFQPVSMLSNPFGDGTINYTLSSTTNFGTILFDTGQDQIGTMNLTSLTTLVLPSSAGAAPTTAASLAYDTTQKSLLYGGAGTLSGSIPRVLYLTQGGADSTTGLVAATINTTETAFADTFSLPANYLTANKRVRVTYSLAWNSTASPTFQVRLRLGGTGGASPSGTTVVTSGAVTPTSTGGTEREMQIQFTITGTAAAGASTNVYSSLVTGYTALAVTPIMVNVTAQPVAAIATNGALPIWLSVQYNGNTASNSVKLHSMCVEELN